MRLPGNTQRRAESGYALLLAVFMVASLLIFSAAVTPNILFQGRREREEEMVFRGEQYKRAIGLYFRKFGRYPTKIEDLTMSTNGVRFLRQAFPEPMNKADGSWRFIFIGPGGQLIGSLRRTSLLQSVMGMPTLPGATPAGAISQPIGSPNTMPGIGGAGFGGPQANLSNSGAMPGSLGAQPQPLTGDVLGGNIIGVASKVKQASLRVYEGGDTYEMWEFIWNPMNQVAIPGAGAIPLPPQIGAPGVATPSPMPTQPTSPTELPPPVNPPPTQP